MEEIQTERVRRFEQSRNEDRGVAEVDGEVRGVAKEAHHPRSRSLPLAPLAPSDRRSPAAPAQVVGMWILVYLTAISSWQTARVITENSVDSNTMTAELGYTLAIQFNEDGR